MRTGFLVPRYAGTKHQRRKRILLQLEAATMWAELEAPITLSYAPSEDPTAHCYRYRGHGTNVCRPAGSNIRPSPTKSSPASRHALGPPTCDCARFEHPARIVNNHGFVGDLDH